MNQKQFEQKIKQSVAQHEMPIDTDNLWDAIEPALPPQRKKRSFLWLWLLCGALGVYGLLYHLGQKNTDMLAVKPIEPVNTNTSDSKPQRNTVDLGNKLPLQHQATTLEKITEAIPKTQNSITKSNNIKKGAVKSEALTFVSSENQKTIIDEIQTERIDTHSKNLKESLPLVSAENSNISTTNIPLKETKEIQKVNYDESIIAPEWQLLTSDLPELGLHLPYVPDALPASDEEPKTRKFIVESAIAGGILSPQRQLHSNDNLASVLVQKRKKAESNRLSMTAQWTGKIQLPKSLWYFKTGLRYTNIQMKLDYQNVETQRVWDENGISSIIINLQGDSLLLRDGNWVTETTSHQVRHYNRFQFLDVPLLVGKDFRLHQKWTWGLETGTAVNLLFQKEGRFLGERESGLVIQDYGNSYYKNKSIGWSWSAASHLRYALSEKTHVRLAVHYQQQMQSLTLRTAPISEQWAWWGVQIGIGYRL